MSLEGKDFLFREKDVFVPVLGLPLEETICSCPWDLLQSRSKEAVAYPGIFFGGFNKFS